MKVASVSTALIILILLGMFVNGFAADTTVTSASSGAQRRFGFGFVGGSEIGYYGVSTFFHAMFMTSPYPSTKQLTLNNGIGDVTGYTPEILQLIQLAAPYPNIKIGIDVAFDVSNPTQWAQFTNSLNSWASSPYSSAIGYVGFAIEQLNIVTTSQNSTWQQHAFQMMAARISSTPFQFVSYYPQGLKGGSSSSGWPTAYQFMVHTNYPEGDNANVLNSGVGQANIVGITHGSDGHQIFPAIGCNFQGVPNWSTRSFANGFYPSSFPSGVLSSLYSPCDNIIPGTTGFPPTIDQALGQDNSNPLANRQWDNFIAGGMGTQNGDGYPPATFIGVSGVSTSFLWDHPTYRQEMTQWLANTPNSFLTSTGSAITTTSSTSSTTTTSTSRTTTSASTTSSTSRSTSSASTTTTTSSASTRSSASTTTRTETSATSSSTSSSTSTESTATSSSTASTSATTSTTSTGSTSASSTTTTTTESTASSTTASSSDATTTTTGATSAVSQPLVNLALTQGYGSAMQGGSQTFVAEVQLTSNSGQPATLTSNASSSGLSVTFSPSQGTGSFSSIALAQVPLTVAPGVYAIVVQAACGAVADVATFYLSVTPEVPNNLLTISSSPGAGGYTVPASGVYSYPLGSSATFAAFPATGWVFDHWEMNGANVGTFPLLTTPVAENDTTLTAVFVFEPSSSQPTATVSFLSQGSGGGTLGVDGKNYSLPTSFNWPLGSVHSVTAYSADSPSTRTDFLGWGSTPSSTVSHFSLVVNGSMLLVANYQKTMLSTIHFVDSRGGQVSVSNATLLGPAGVFSASSNQSFWSEPGARYSLVSARYMNSNVAPTGSSADQAQVIRPGTINFPLRVYESSVRVVDITGSPLGGVTVTINTKGGETLSAVTDGDGIARFARVPMGAYTGQLSYLGVSYGFGQASAGSSPLTVTVALSYPIVGVVLVVAALSSFTVLRRARKKPSVESLA